MTNPVNTQNFPQFLVAVAYNRYNVREYVIVDQAGYLAAKCGGGYHKYQVKNQALTVCRMLNNNSEHISEWKIVQGAL